MKNNIYTAIPDWFNKVQSQSTDNTSTTTTQTTIIGGGGSSISMSVHNLFIKSDTTITIDDFTISDLFVTDQITDTENWLTTPLLHTLPNTEVSVTTAAQQLYIGAYDKNNNQIKLYQFSEAISTVVIPENCYYLRASSNKTNTDLTIKYVGLNNFDETQQNKLESSSFQNFLTLVEGDEKGVITNSVQNLSLVFQNPLYYTLDKAGNVLISIDRDALFSQSENPTDDRYVTTVANSVQDILSSKNFKEGLSINGIEIVERNGFLYIKGNLATTGGITAYTDDPDDPGGSGGLPGGGAIGDIVITGSGNALVDASLSEDHSVITFTKGWLVDAESDQSITGIKDFINGLKLSGQLIKIVDGVLFLDCSIAATGGITAYATMPGEGSSSIMDQLVVDTEYFIITEEGVLTIVPGSVGGISNIYVTGNGNALTTVTLSEDGKTVSFTKDKNFADQAEMSAYKSEVNQTIAEFKNEVNEQLKHFVTLDTEQEITAIKHFIEGVTIGSNKHKFYEKDGVLWLEGDIAITGGITTYATENVDASTIMDGVTVDEITITKGSDNILRIKNAGTGSSFDENAMWSALSGSSDNQINKSHLTMALDGYATRNWVIENYATKSELSAVSNKLNDFLEGSDTDTIINKWKELEAFLSGMVETDNLAEILETKADKKYVDSTFVTLATKQTITGEKTFSSVLNTAAIKASGAITAPSLAVSDWVTIAGIKLRKLEDGALMLEGNLALTGALTMYASNGQSFGTIYDGLPIDNDTIYWQEVDGSRVLKAREGSGSSFDKSAMWTALAGSTTEQINKSHLTTALTGYATESWVSGKNYAVKATTLAGYGITDGINAVSVTGTGNAVTDASVKGHILTLTKGSTFSLSGHKHAWADITSGKPSTLSGYGITDAYTKTESDSKYPTKTGSGASGTWGINVTGNAGTATKLQTARSLWGNNFDGTANISGDITLAVGKGIYLSANDERWLLQTKRSDNTQINGIKTNGFQMCTYFGDTKTMQFNSDRIYSDVDFRAQKDLYINGIRLHKTADGVITLEGNLAVTGGITTYAIDPVSASTIMDGVVVDGVTIKKENGKLVAVGGGEAGSVAWGNITGKPSVYATNIANITDLHSSWDAVLKAQKPAWLTAVSIATISDLHANWDALLKAAPSAYVTRWPTISEVTGKQNLVIKLNGGTTEGTNQFTYNATAAKSLNITASSVGAAASSHSHSQISATVAGTNSLDMVYAKIADNDYFRLRVGGTASNEGYVELATADDGNERIYVRQYTGTFTTVKRTLTLLDGSGNSSFPGTVTASTFSGSLNGNATSASKLQTTHTIWGQNFNGTQNVSGEIINCTRIRNTTENPLYLGNSNNASWVYTQDIASHNGVESWAIGVTGTGWFQKINIGYTHPNYGPYSLNVNGVISSPAYTGRNIRIECDNDGNNLEARSSEINNYNGKLYLQHDTSQDLICCKGGGNVGIGVDSPTYSLQVVGTIYTNGLVSAYGYSGNHIRIECDNNGGNRDQRIDEINNYTAPLYLQHNTGNNLICCNGGGNVGIGTTSPAAKLDVNGDIFCRSVESTYTSTANEEFSIDRSNLWCKAVPVIPNYKYRYVLGWQDKMAGGYITGYGIGTYRSNDGSWGSMTFEVCQYESNKTRKAQLEIRGRDNILWFSGDILAEGGGTFYGSDIRYKQIIQQVELSLQKIAEAPSFIYHWNKEGMKCDRLNLGGSAQYTQSILPWAVEENNGFLNMDYATVAYTFSVHTARHLLDYETKTDKEIRKLKNRIKYLEKQLKSLHYEEANIVDN